MSLELDINTEPRISCPWTGNHPRDGLNLVLFGLDDDCQVLKEISDELDMDLSMIAFPGGLMFNELQPPTIDAALMIFERLLLRLQRRTNLHLSYPAGQGYVDGHHFQTDVQAMVDYLRCCKMKGAQSVWFAASDGRGNIAPAPRITEYFP